VIQFQTSGRAMPSHGPCNAVLQHHVKLCRLITVKWYPPYTWLQARSLLSAGSTLYITKVNCVTSWRSFLSKTNYMVTKFGIHAIEETLHLPMFL